VKVGQSRFQFDGLLLVGFGSSVGLSCRFAGRFVQARVALGLCAVPLDPVVSVVHLRGDLVNAGLLSGPLRTMTSFNFR